MEQLIARSAHIGKVAGLSPAIATVMAKLTKEALDHLTIIHKLDVRKVIDQIEVVAGVSEKVESLQKLTKEEYQTLIQLSKKYLDMLGNL